MATQTNLTPTNGIEIERVLQAAKEHFGGDRFDFEYEPGETQLNLLFKYEEGENNVDFEVEVTDWLTARGVNCNWGAWFCEDVDWSSDGWKWCPHLWDDPEWVEDE